MGENYEKLAKEYAEKYGIEEYHVRGCELYYYMTFPSINNSEPYTVKVVINLKTFSYEMLMLKKVLKEGLCNTQ